MSTKIFVGGLNWDTTDEGFRKFFASYGEIEEASVMRERATGTSRGFGFVVRALAVSDMPALLCLLQCRPRRLAVMSEES